MPQISPDHIKRLRRQPQPDDDYNWQILQWREMGFITIPGTQVPLDNIRALTEEGQRAWAKSRYCDWYVLEQTAGSDTWRKACDAAKEAREAFEAQLTHLDATQLPLTYYSGSEDISRKSLEPVLHHNISFQISPQSFLMSACVSPL